MLVPELEHLGAEHDDVLAPQRLAELTDAMALLGVTDFVRLGGDGRFRDSGMAYDDKGRAIARDVLRDGIFWTADLLEAANHLVALVRDRRPQVLVAYNEVGGYGHPDHVQAHRVATYGTLLAGVEDRPDLGEPWTVDRVVWSTMSATRMGEMIAPLRAAGDTETFAGWEDAAATCPWCRPTRTSRPWWTAARTSPRSSTPCGPTRPRSVPTARSSPAARCRSTRWVARVLPLRLGHPVPHGSGRRPGVGGRPVRGPGLTRTAEPGRRPSAGGGRQVVVAVVVRDSAARTPRGRRRSRSRPGGSASGRPGGPPSRPGRARPRSRGPAGGAPAGSRRPRRRASRPTGARVRARRPRPRPSTLANARGRRPSSSRVTSAGSARWGRYASNAARQAGVSSSDTTTRASGRCPPRRSASRAASTPVAT